MSTDNDAQAESGDKISADSKISRDDWKLRIGQARDWAEQARRAWRLAPHGSARKPDPPEKIATERVLTDDTLQPGDIVATDKGLFVFRRVPGIDGEKREFVPLRPVLEPSRPKGKGSKIGAAAVPEHVQFCSYWFDLVPARARS